MITTESVDSFAATLGKIVAQLPAVLDDMRATAVDRQRLLAALEATHREIDSLNITIVDLRDDKRALDGRVTALLAENARIECLLKNIGAAIKESTEVQDSLAELAGSRNGRASKLIEASTVTPAALPETAAPALNGAGAAS